LTGSTYAAGTYLDSEVGKDLYTIIAAVSVGVATGTNYNAKKITNAIVDKLVIENKASEDFKITASIKGKDFTIFQENSQPYGTIGSFSNSAPFEWFQGTVLVGGNSFDVTSFQVTSMRNITENQVLGYKNPTKYEFGKYTCEGVLEIDAPNDVFGHLREMGNNGTISVSGTWATPDGDLFIVSIPNGKFKPFDVNVPAGDSRVNYGLAFKAYESDDGQVSPIMVKTVSYQPV
jgi:hypothetical protein